MDVAVEDLQGRDKGGDKGVGLEVRKTQKRSLSVCVCVCACVGVQGLFDCMFYIFVETNGGDVWLVPMIFFLPKNHQILFYFKKRKEQTISFW